MSEYTYDIDKYTIGVDENGEDGIGMTVAKIENGELHFLGNCYGENARCIDLLIKKNQSLKKENKILRENAEHNDKVVDKVNWENQLLKKQIKTLDKTNIQLISKLDRYDAIVDERDELKKQLTTYQILHRDCKVDNLKNISKIEEMENQQKEFIEYLKDKLRIANEVLDEPEEDEEARGYVLTRKFMLEEILSKYQEIMGVINNYVKDKR